MADDKTTGDYIRDLEEIVKDNQGTIEKSTPEPRKNFPWPIVVSAGTALIILVTVGYKIVKEAKSGRMEPVRTPGKVIEVDGDALFAALDAKDKAAKAIQPGDVAAYLEQHPINIYSYEKSIFSLNEYLEDSTEKEFSIKNLLDYLRDVGYTVTEYTEKSIRSDLERQGVSILGDEADLGNRQNVNIVTFYRLPEIDIKIAIYESYMNYLQKYSKAQAQAEVNTKVSNVLYGQGIPKPSETALPGNLFGDYSTLYIRRGQPDMSDEEYLQKLIVLCHEYSARICACVDNEMTIQAWEKYFQQRYGLRLIDIELEEKRQEEEAIAEIAKDVDITLEEAKIVYDLVNQGIGKLYEEKEINYLIGDGDNSLRDISNNLAKQGIYISANDIRTQTRQKLGTKSHRVLGDNTMCPQKGKTLSLWCPTELSLDAQKLALKKAYLYYIASLDGKLPEEIAFVQPIASACCTGAEKSQEDTDDAWGMVAGACSFGPDAGIMPPEKLNEALAAANRIVAQTPEGSFTAVIVNLGEVPSLS